MDVPYVSSLSLHEIFLKKKIENYYYFSVAVSIKLIQGLERVEPVFSQILVSSMTLMATL